MFEKYTNLWTRAEIWAENWNKMYNCATDIKQCRGFAEKVYVFKHNALPEIDNKDKLGWIYRSLIQ